ncbi:MAG: AI-2E family transporter [Actinobacteria bacterium]|nr:AI-2E family transporter [Actinomycetota bacterium]MBW3649162.1 AI-2E family transporter [Actinomycetota bacterium]
MPDSPETAGAPRPPERLRVTGRSVALAVAVVGITLVLLRVLASAERVVAWALIASSVAALLHPAVEWLERRMPRGLAVLLVAVTTLVAIGGVGYGLVGGLVRETRNLQRQAPRLAAELERSGRFSEAATELDLSERVAGFVDSVPERLRGGTPAEAVRAAATRGLAFLAVAVLTLFFLLHGPRLAAGAARQLHDEGTRARASAVAGAVYRRAFGYARGTLVMSGLAGLLGYGVARAFDVPGPAPLAVWVALWDAVPVLGAVVGALPIVLLATAADPAAGAAVAVVFMAYEVFEYLVLQRPLERRTVRVGPFLTTAGGFAGLELFGLAGALLAVLGLAVGAVVLDELAAP